MFRCSRCGANITVDAPLCDSCNGSATPTGDEPTISHVGETLAASRGRERLQLVPGTVLADRYRIVSLVGEGGMGKVYRADDLKLGQTVALKFISPSRASDASWVRRLYSEVRNARSVSHPNVCRVHDIAEHEGKTFLSMEYVDGEDLASLLVRIGHPPIEKVTALAWQICSGLAAAHAKGIIHRDLKPGNIMIDGRGQARITDFGLATASDDRATFGEVAGTRGYMAPEQLSGVLASFQTDLFSLGLVLYELHTGKRPDSAIAAAGNRKQPTPPSRFAPEMSRAASDAILRCLQMDPRDRPSSALEVAAAFPFDPIAEAIVRNETPAPEVVASLEVAQLTTRVAWAWLGAVLLGLAILFALAPYMEEPLVAPLPKSPEILAERAQEIIRELGHSAPARDVYFKLDRNRAMSQYRASQTPPLSMQSLNSAAQGVIVLDYLQSDTHSLSNFSLPGSVTFSEPSADAGDVTVRIDSRGQLLRFQAVPEPPAGSTPSLGQADWSIALRLAGFAESSLKVSTSQSFIPYAYDERREWDYTYPGPPEIPLHIVAAAARGRIVYFEVRAPWNLAIARKKVYEKQGRFAATTIGIGTLLVLLLGLFVVRNNARSQRADRAGALRVAGFVLLVTLASDLLLAHFPSDISKTPHFILRVVADALFVAAFVWVAYMAVEPFIRKRMPHVMNSWIRLLDGRYLDPTVGRDILIGSLLGVVMELGTAVCWYLPAWFRVPFVVPGSGFWTFMIGTRGALAGFLLSAQDAVYNAFGTLVFFSLARMIVRRNTPAFILTGFFLIAVGSQADHFLFGLAAAFVISAICLLALLRFGLLAYVACLFVFFVLIKFPHTLDLKLWYSTQSIVMVLAVVALAAFGLRTSVGNQPLFGGLIKDV